MEAKPPPTCPRCESQRGWDAPPVWLRWLRRAWFGGLLLLLPAAPIMMSDYMVMLPALAVYMLGAGPALGAGDRDHICRACGAAWSPPLGPVRRWIAARRGGGRANLRLVHSAPPARERASHPPGA